MSQNKDEIVEVIPVAITNEEQNTEIPKIDEAEIDLKTDEKAPETEASPTSKCSEKTVDIPNEEQNIEILKSVEAEVHMKTNDNVPEIKISSVSECNDDTSDIKTTDVESTSQQSESEQHDVDGKTEAKSSAEINEPEFIQSNESVTSVKEVIANSLESTDATNKVNNEIAIESHNPTTEEKSTELPTTSEVISKDEALTSLMEKTESHKTEEKVEQVKKKKKKKQSAAESDESNKQSDVDRRDSDQATENVQSIDLPSANTQEKNVDKEKSRISIQPEQTVADQSQSAEQPEEKSKKKKKKKQQTDSSDQDDKGNRSEEKVEPSAVEKPLNTDIVLPPATTVDQTEEVVNSDDKSSKKKKKKKSSEENEEKNEVCEEVQTKAAVNEEKNVRVEVVRNSKAEDVSTQDEAYEPSETVKERKIKKLKKKSKKGKSEDTFHSESSVGETDAVSDKADDSELQSDAEHHLKNGALTEVKLTSEREVRALQKLGSSEQNSSIDIKTDDEIVESFTLSISSTKESVSEKSVEIVSQQTKREVVASAGAITVTEEHKTETKIVAVETKTVADNDSETAEVTQSEEETNEEKNAEDATEEEATEEENEDNVAKTEDREHVSAENETEKKTKQIENKGKQKEEEEEEEEEKEEEEKEEKEEEEEGKEEEVGIKDKTYEKNDSANSK